MIGKDEIMIKVMKKIHQENNQRFMNRRTAKSFWRMQFESVPENCFVSMFLTGGTADPLLLTKCINSSVCGEKLPNSKFKTRKIKNGKIY